MVDTAGLLDIHIQPPEIYMKYCLLQDNYAGLSGGAVYLGRGASLEVYGSGCHSNFAEVVGGCLWASTYSYGATAQQTSFHYNTANSTCLTTEGPVIRNATECVWDEFEKPGTCSRGMFDFKLLLCGQRECSKFSNVVQLLLTFG